MLPVTEISLYSSGVGFFERDGQVEGRAQVDLRFKTDDINDLLKSMVVRDSQSGRVASVTYGSRDPLTRTLRSFGIDLTENPTLGQLLNQARGEQVTLQWPTPLTGTILGVEKKKQPVGENKEMDVEYLNLVTDDGLQSIPLAQVQKVRLLNDRLDAELHQALTLLAASHDKDKKTVSITFDGEGKRDVAVSYVVQTPVWKTSYRLVVDDKADPVPARLGHRGKHVRRRLDERQTRPGLRPAHFLRDGSLRAALCHAAGRATGAFPFPAATSLSGCH